MNSQYDLTNISVKKKEFDKVFDDPSTVLFGVAIDQLTNILDRLEILVMFLRELT